jgi:hypothetical protein
MNKYDVAVEIMTANEDKPMAEVAQMIASATDMPINQARAYYIRAVRMDHAPGKIVLEKRGRKQGSKLNRDKSTDAVNIDQLTDIMSDVYDEAVEDNIKQAA